MLAKQLPETFERLDSFPRSDYRTITPLIYANMQQCFLNSND